MSNATPEDESYGWWGDFLAARTKALHAMRRLGRTPTEMVQELNLADGAHAMRILDGTLKDNLP